MVKSMTGFGRGENTGEYKQVTVEIKSVNHRYSEIWVKLPRHYSLLEETVRKYLLSHISRGRLEVYIKLDETGEKERQVQVDKELALAYHRALKELAVLTGTSADVNVIQIAQLPDVLKIEELQETLDDVWKDILPALEQAIRVLIEMRQQEGEKLKADLEERLEYLHLLHARIEEKSPLVVGHYREKLQTRLREMLEAGQVDENRIALEVALFADRSSISEELVRLSSHLQQFEQILRENNPIGRKLDFLLQEMNREVNTIGSKANDLDITQYVVEMKSELEKLREQVQNIE